jgi:uncharacterized protein (TIGR02145 family)
MAENLRTTKYANGDPIPNVTDNTQWSSLSTGAWAHYNNDSQYENPYGKLYNWYTVSDQRNVCPIGWYVPIDADWTILTDYLGGEFIAGGKMKSTGTQYWISPNTGATNESGFTGHPGGFRFGNIGIFEDINYAGYWWSSTNNFSRILINDLSNVYRDDFGDAVGLSVRCLKNITSEINLIESHYKSLIEIYDLFGNKTVIKVNELQFYKYSDGSIEKKIIIE